MKKLFAAIAASLVLAAPQKTIAMDFSPQFMMQDYDEVGCLFNQINQNSMIVKAIVLPNDTFLASEQKYLEAGSIIYTFGYNHENVPEILSPEGNFYGLIERTDDKERQSLMQGFLAADLEQARSNAQNLRALCKQAMMPKSPA